MCRYLAVRLSFPSGMSSEFARTALLPGRLSPSAPDPPVGAGHTLRLRPPSRSTTLKRGETLMCSIYVDRPSPVGVTEAVPLLVSGNGARLDG